MLMPDLLTVIVGGLAVYRAALMIARETGPAHIFERLRRFADLKFGVRSSLAEGLACPLCISFWLSWLAAWPVSTSNYNYVVLALAIASVTVILVKLFRH
jgi:hypothetical protein